MTHFLNDLVYLYPEVFLSVWAMVLLMLGAFQHRKERTPINVLTLCGFPIAIAIIVVNFSAGTQMVMFDLARVSPVSQVIKIIILTVMMLVFYGSYRYFDRSHMNRFEVPVLVLLLSVGLMLMVSANDLMTAFLGIELQALSFYILVAITRDNLRAIEAGMKFFILGAISSCLFLFGASYLYGLAGTTDFPGLSTYLLNAEVTVMTIVALGTILVALCFKVSLAPFHMWAPDVYEGSPTPVTAMIASAPKLAGFGLLSIFLLELFSAQKELWEVAVVVVAVFSILLGSFAALYQKKLKRLLAYSSIAHMGFAALGLLSLAQGHVVIIEYLLIYAVMTVGVFMLLLAMRKRGDMLEVIDDLAGLGADHPVWAMCLAALLFSLAGIPPFAGFFAKLSVLSVALAQGHIIPVTIAVLASVVSAGFYIKIVKAIYFDQPAGGAKHLKVDPHVAAPTRLVYYGATLFVVFYVLKPGWLETLLTPFTAPEKGVVMGP